MISIIVPVYNVENYIDRCIKSIISQTYSDFELILVDDGSTDKSGHICDFWKNKDNRIKVIHKKNGGLSDARNAGLKIASGLYITFVDSDDLIHKQALEIMFNAMVHTDSDMIVSNLLRFENDDDISPLEDIDINFKTDCVSYTNEQALNILLDNSIRSFIPACAKLYKKFIFTNISFPLDRLHEDEYVTHQTLSACKRITHIDTNLYFYYRGNENSICASTMTEKRLTDIIDAYINRIEFIKKNHNSIYNNALYSLLYKIAYLVSKYKKDFSANCMNRINKKYKFYTKEAKKVCKIKPWKDVEIFICAYPKLSYIFKFIYIICNLHKRD